MLPSTVRTERESQQRAQFSKYRHSCLFFLFWFIAQRNSHLTVAWKVLNICIINLRSFTLMHFASFCFVIMKYSKPSNSVTEKQVIFCQLYDLVFLFNCFFHVSARATVMNIFRVPLNLLVIILLVQVCPTFSLWLFFCFLPQLHIIYCFGCFSRNV